MKNPIMKNGQLIIPGSLAKDSPLHPRNGKPKSFRVTDVHPGMIHSHEGTMIAGISRTQANDPQHDARLLTKPDDGKRPMPHEVMQTPGIHGLNGSLPTKIVK
jgi:hypothetical protein